MSTVSPVKICTGSCTWTYNDGSGGSSPGWTVSKDGCTSPCGCSSAAYLPAGVKLLPKLWPDRPIEHDDFCVAVSRMDADGRVANSFKSTHQKPQRLGKDQPALKPGVKPLDGTTYDMPCVN
jgi:hypothetical protein